MFNFKIAIPAVYKDEINLIVKRRGQSWIDVVSPLVDKLERKSASALKLECEVLMPGKMKVTIVGSKRFFILTNLDYEPEEVEEDINDLPETIAVELETENKAEEDKVRLQKYMMGIDSAIGKGSFENKSKKFLEETHNWIKAGSSSVVKYLRAEKSYLFSAVSGEGSENLLNKSFPVETGIMGLCIKKNISLHVRNVENDERFARNIAEKTGIEVKDLFCVPISNGYRVTGATEFLNSSSGFKDVDIEIVKYGVKFLS